MFNFRTSLNIQTFLTMKFFKCNNVTNVISFFIVPPPTISSATGDTVVAGTSATISCVITLTSFNSYNMDTYIEVLSTGDLLSQIVTAGNSKTVSHTLNSVAISQAGDYSCSARVFYNGAFSAYVINSTTSNPMTATLNVTSKFTLYHLLMCISSLIN